ncbi:hypothetical protein [Nocardia sp. NPDC049149]|uniref:hypothetical protein n=1 Tax=Nocardia sp. NPDC049149 TaxID=3364315 RepID=UPI00371F0C3E
MAREYARIRLSRWDDNDWLDLTPAAQHLYDVLATDPDLSYCGRADWRPKRLTQRARGWTEAAILTAAAELEQERFILFDPLTEEALVRSLIRSDELLRNPKMGISVAKAYGALASRTLRAAVVTELRRAKEEHPEYSSWTSPMSSEQLARLVNLPGLDSVGYTNQITNHIGDAGSVTNANADQPVSVIPTQAGITNADRSVSYLHTAYRIQQPYIQQPIGGYVTGEPHYATAAANDPPAPHCESHPGGTPEPCGPCADARRRWVAANLERDQAAERAAVERTEAHRQAKREAAELRAAEIRRCGMCDADGYLDDGQGARALCDHRPPSPDRPSLRQQFEALKREAGADG